MANAEKFYIVLAPNGMEGFITNDPEDAHYAKTGENTSVSFSSVASGFRDSYGDYDSEEFVLHEVTLPDSSNGDGKAQRAAPSVPSDIMVWLRAQASDPNADGRFHELLAYVEERKPSVPVARLKAIIPHVYSEGTNFSYKYTTIIFKEDLEKLISEYDKENAQ